MKWIQSPRVIGIMLVLAGALVAQTTLSGSANAIPTSALINAGDVAALLQSKADKPVILQIGSHVLFQQAHVPGSEYVGAASTAAGRQQLQKRAASLPKDKLVILYCGCCPWEHCPNVKPAYDELQATGFSNVKVMFIQNNFGKDWVEKGYPTAKGD